MTRICMDCAVDTKFYRHLKPVNFQGRRYYHCHKCDRVGTAGRRCRYVWKPHEEMPIMCLWVLECYDPDRKPTYEPLSAIESLDEDIMKKIVQHLEYRDAIELERTSREMAFIIEPTKMVPIHERFLLTNEKFTGRLQHPKNIPKIITDFHTRAKLACFVCFRIRDSKYFSQRQIDMAQHNPDTYYKLRCNTCLGKMYEQGDQKLLDQYSSYRMCPACHCLAVKSERCENCAEWKATGKPLDGPPYPIPAMRRSWLFDQTENFEAEIGSPPEPRRSYHYLTPETFPLRKKPVLRTENDFDEDEFIRKIVQNQKE